MKEKHQTIIDKLTDGLQRLTKFLSNYDVPEWLSLLDSSLGDKELHFYHNFRWDSERQRETGLYDIGKVFGTDGWTATQNSLTDITWKKTVDGVEIELAGAKSMPEPLPTPVLPKEFPVMLMDATVVE